MLSTSNKAGRRPAEGNVQFILIVQLLGYNEMGLHYGARQRVCSFCLRERVIGDLMKALKMMEVMVGSDIEFLVQGRKKSPVSPSPLHFFSVRSATTLL